MPIIKTPKDYYLLAESKGYKWLGPEVKTTVVKTWFECPSGHRWKTNYRAIQNGQGCRRCFTERLAERDRKKPKDYHSLARERDFIWLGPEVPNVTSKTKWECQLGHRWLARFSKIQGGNGCPYCAGKARKTPEDYHILANQNGFIWLGPQVDKVHTKTLWQCPLGHRWESGYADIQQGYGCWLCGINKKAYTQKKKPSDYHALAQVREFVWLGPEAHNRRAKTGWQCKYSHQWEANYNDIKRGNGCPACQESKGENRIAQVLTSLNIPFVREKRFDNCRNKRSLPFDFYFRIDKQVFLVEYQGGQHYKPVEYFGGKNGFDETRRRDKIKAKFAQENEFILICIPYTEHENIENILREAIAIKSSMW